MSPLLSSQRQKTPSLATALTGSLPQAFPFYPMPFRSCKRPQLWLQPLLLPPLFLPSSPRGRWCFLWGGEPLVLRLGTCKGRPYNRECERRGGYTVRGPHAHTHNSRKPGPMLFPTQKSLCRFWATSPARDSLSSSSQPLHLTHSPVCTARRSSSLLLLRSLELVLGHVSLSSYIHLQEYRKKLAYSFKWKNTYLFYKAVWNILWVSLQIFTTIITIAITAATMATHTE